MAYYHQMADLRRDAHTMLCVYNNWLPSSTQHNRCQRINRQGRRERIKLGMVVPYYSITCGNDTTSISNAIRLI